MFKHLNGSELMKKILMVETNVSHYGKSVDPTVLWLGDAAKFDKTRQKTT